MYKLCTSLTTALHYSELIVLDLIMWSGEDESSIRDLPPEIVTQITNFLPHVDKKSCKLTCHQWNYIVSNFCNNIKFRAHLHNDSLDHFLISNLIFDIIYMGGLTKRFPRMSHPKTHFPNIKHVQICGPNSQAATMNMFKYGLEHTTTLHILEDSLQTVQRFVISGNIQNFKWNNLMKFMLNVQVREDKRHLGSCSTLLKYSKMTNLRQFGFYFVDWGNIKNQKIQFKRLFLNMYTFLFNNSQSLIELNFSINYHGEDPRWFEILKAKNSIGSSMNIETCKLSMGGNYRSLGIEYLISPNLIGSNLKKICIDYWCGNYDYWNGNEENYFNQFRHVFEANVKCLETVKITGRGGGRLHLVWLKDCSLKNLILPEECVFSHPFQLRIVNTYPSCIEYQQLFVKIRDKLEHLTLGIRIPCLMNTNLLWLNSCTGLKSLSLNLDSELLLLNKNLTFPNLIGFKLYFYNNQITQHQIDYKWNWVKQNMPNVEILKMYGYCNEYGLTASLTGLKVVFTMKKLKKIYFDLSRKYDPMTSTRKREELRIMNHCDNTPGLSFKKIHGPLFYSYGPLENVIQIDRSIYMSS